MHISTWSDGFPKMSAILPDGATSGKAHIKHAHVSTEQATFAAIRASMRGRGLVTVGDVYTQLFHKGVMWMSDTHDERRDHRYVYWQAQGDVLIAGLGLGMVTLAVAMKPEVSSVTVVEFEPDVIALVEPHLRSALGDATSKLTVVQSDIFQWKPPKGSTYDTIWFDVWETICTDNLDGYHKLHRRFARCLKPGGYRGSWAYEQIKRYKRHEDRNRVWWR